MTVTDQLIMPDQEQYFVSLTSKLTINLIQGKSEWSTRHLQNISTL